MSYEYRGSTIYYAGAPGSPLTSRTGGVVNYEEIKAQYKGGKLWKDIDFPDTKSSIGTPPGDRANELSGKPPQLYQWLRPKDICKAMGLAKPDFAVVNDDSGNAVSTFDTRQGSLGNCWYIAALGALATKPDMVDKVIPRDNYTGFEPENYCGAFHFRFYSMSYCKWVDVVVDDLLPCKPGQNRRTPPKLAFAAATASDDATIAEFWAPLIEKAYAKFVGSYEKIDGGLAAQALEDFTGGFGQFIEFKENLENFGFDELKALSHPARVQRAIQNAMDAGYFASFSSYGPEKAGEVGAIKGYSSYSYDLVLNRSTWTQELITLRRGYVRSGGRYIVDQFNDRNTGFGLIGPHAYTVLACQEVVYNGSPIFLIKLRNPHGRTEWCGNFSDEDNDNWAKCDRDLRIKDGKTGNKNIDEGIFWIELGDAMKYFARLQLCYFGLDSENFKTVTSEFPAEIQSKSIGFNSYDQFRHFQAYKFQVEQGEASKARSGNVGNKALVLLQLQLDGVNSVMGMQNTIPSFHARVFKVTDEELGRGLAWIYRNNPHVALPQNYGGLRGASAMAILEPGTYIIVPILETLPRTRMAPEYEGKPIKFAIRIFTENDTKLEPLPLEGPKINPPPQQSIKDQLVKQRTGSGGGNNSDLEDILNILRSAGITIKQVYD